jgi:hypothetical protein
VVEANMPTLVAVMILCSAFSPVGANTPRLSAGLVDRSKALVLPADIGPFVRSLEPPESGQDSVKDGVVRGALIGAGIMAGLMSWAYIACDDGCEAPSPGGTYSLAAGVGAGAGALIGWLVDRGHNSAPHAERTVAVAPVLSRHGKGAVLTVRF